MKNRFSASARAFRCTTLNLLWAGLALADNVPLTPANHLLDQSRVLRPLTRRQLGYTLLAEQHQSGISVYVAVSASSSVPPEKIAGRLAEAWLAEARGAVIVLAADKREASVVPSDRLQRTLGRDALTQYFLRGAKASLSRGDFDSAVTAGVDSLLDGIRENLRHPPLVLPLPRRWLFGIAAAVLLVVALIILACLRAWKFSNLFDRRYRFAASAPALRFGGTQSGGHTATLHFRETKPVNEPARP